MSKVRVLIPGSFDPPTKAHEAIWIEAAKTFDVVIAIGRNAAKSNPLFHMAARRTLIERILYDNAIAATVVEYDDLIDQCAKREGAEIIVRGVRGSEDLAGETAFKDYMERRKGPTVYYLLAPAALRACSSTFVRGLLGFEGADEELEFLLPKSVFRCLKDGANDLRADFLRLWKQMRAEGDGAAVFEDLLLRYGEERRAYHTMAHVKYNLARLDELYRAMPENGTAMHDWQAVRFAMYFHDAVMFCPHEENKSAALATQTALAAKLPASQVVRIGQIIEAATVNAPWKHVDADLHLDADLSILGADEEVFDKYEADVREEWKKHSNADYRAGRLAVLETIMKRPHIYTTPEARSMWEVAAWSNLRRSMAKLGGKES